MPAFNDPARRSGAGKSKKEEGGRARQNTRGGVWSQSDGTRGAGHETRYKGGDGVVQARSWGMGRRRIGRARRVGGEQSATAGTSRRQHRTSENEEARCARPPKLISPVNGRGRRVAEMSPRYPPVTDPSIHTCPAWTLTLRGISHPKTWKWSHAQMNSFPAEPSAPRIPC